MSDTPEDTSTATGPSDTSSTPEQHADRYAEQVLGVQPASNEQLAASGLLGPGLGVEGEPVKLSEQEAEAAIAEVLGRHLPPANEWFSTGENDT
jgi:hypothetical protein